MRHLSGTREPQGDRRGAGAPTRRIRSRSRSILGKVDTSGAIRGRRGGRQGSAAWESERKIGDPSRDLVASRRASAVRVRATAWTVPETDATPSTDSPQTTQDLVSELSPESAPEPEPGPEPELPAEAAAEPEREAWAEIVPEPEPEPKEPESALDLEPEPADAENSQPVDKAWVKPIIEAKPDIRSKKGKKAKKAKKGESQDACCLC
ncbi:hypothetical protein CT0861_09536 [Colletotrichum tofieldiae]|uniref:Uncharacterized protein n=1 Tax=Colletotrichum tofieldiae TaxID=708197 RepID=A0A166MTF1_9PEZI|nr:hypothetical protein CT0861_09536 [Colletotrichum tofieldiae]